MRTIAPMLLACAAGLWIAPSASAPLAACLAVPAMAGMRERFATMHEQMNRIDWTHDRAERHALMDLHMKHMHESLREIRRRDLNAACRTDLLGSMLDEMAHHEQALGEQETR